MTPADATAITARLETLHDDMREIKSDVKEVKKEVKETNGRVRKLELWRAETKARLSLLASGARISTVHFLAPILTGVVIAAAVILLSQ